MEELLLNKEELYSIETFVTNNPHLFYSFAFHLSTEKTSVIKVSKTGLILVLGNRDTGFEHIRLRHDYWSQENYWLNDNTIEGPVKKKLQNQSKFRPDSIPIDDYTDIADSIFKLENNNLEKNSRPELFDVYQGKHQHHAGNLELYRLVLYKNTKVIHSIFPVRDKNNKKRVKDFPFARGTVRYAKVPDSGIVEIMVPYVNEDDKIQYALRIIKYIAKGKEDLIISFYDNGVEEIGFIEIETRDILEYNNDNIELINWQHADLRSIEEYILNIHLGRTK